LLKLAGAAAQPVTYTIRCNMAGSLNGQPLSGPLTVTALGDIGDMMLPCDGHHPYTWTGDLQVTFDLPGCRSFSGNPSRFLLVSSGPTLGLLMMSPDKPHGTPGFLMKTAGGLGYDIGSRASAEKVAYESAHCYPGAVHTEAGWFKIDSVHHCAFQAVVAQVRGATESSGGRRSIGPVRA
jgi:hypothetical protein